MKLNLYNNYYDSPEKKFYSAQLVRTPGLARKLGYWLGGIGLLLFVLLFIPWTQNFKSKGKLTSLNPEDRPQTLHSTIAGRIEKWYIREGSNVKKGDTILYISEVKDKFFDPDFLSRIKEQINSKEGALGSTKEKAAALEKQINALSDGMKYSLSKATNKVQQSKLKISSDSIEFVASKTNYEIADEQYKRQEKLYQQGLKSLTDLEGRRLKLQESQAKLLSAENKYYTSKNEMMNAIIELNSIEAEYLDKISKAESELSSTLAYYFDTEGAISKMNNEYANMQIRNSFYYITAPQDGILVKALRSGVGETIKEGEEVATIMPANPQIAAELYVDPMDVILLRKGSKIRLQFEGWPALVFSGWPGVTFGTFSGEVRLIDNIDTKGLYRILVVPDNPNEEWPKQLRVGSGVYGWAMLEDVPVWYEIWRQLNGFPPNYIDHSKDTEKKKEKKDEED